MGHPATRHQTKSTIDPNSGSNNLRYVLMAYSSDIPEMWSLRRRALSFSQGVRSKDLSMSTGNRCIFGSRGETYVLASVRYRYLMMVWALSSSCCTPGDLKTNSTAIEFRHFCSLFLSFCTSKSNL